MQENPPSGCVFRTRCPAAMEICKDVKPVWQEIAAEHHVACHLYNENDKDSPKTGPQRIAEKDTI